MPAEIRRRKLKNGLTILTEKMPDVRSVCIGIWLKKGSRDESKRQNGISHFIEHLVFKGTENRSARELAL
ncbi:MAG: insulinase family protein, partial [Acidobacteriota bacterium]